MDPRGLLLVCLAAVGQGRRMLRAKVAVVGLGAAGAAALWALSRAGVDAIGIERVRIAHEGGSSHGQTRLVRVAYAEGERYVPLVRRAIGLWRELEAETGETAFHNTGVFYAGPANSDFVTSSLASARAFNVAVDGGVQPPPHQKIDGGWTRFLEREGGFLESDRALAALVAAAVKRGARTLFDTEVRSIAATSTGVELATSAGDVRADLAVVAAGAWSGALYPPLARLLLAERKVLHWFADPRRDFSLAAGFKPFIVDVGGGSALYGFPTLDERGVKIAEHGFAEPVAGDMGDRAVRPDDVARIRELVVPAFGDLGAPVESKVCYYPMSRDGHFIIDRVDRIVVGTGLSGHGFKFAPALGEALANLALERAQAVDVGFLRLGRFG